MTAKKARTPEVVLDELADVGGRIAKAEADLEQLYPRRLALFQEGKAFDPPVVNRRLGEAAGVQENAVIAALRKARNKAAEVTT